MKGSSPLFANYLVGDSSFEYNCSYSIGEKISSYLSSPLHGNSQTYKKQYTVYAKMIKIDIKHGVYDKKTGYTKNPTAQDLDSLINGNYIVNKHFTKRVPYVVTTNGKIVIGDRNGNGRALGALPTPHPTLIGGKNPKVRMAGILDVRGGKIYSYDDKSGHYRPNAKSIKWADKAFKNFPKDKRFKGGK